MIKQKMSAAWAVFAAATLLSGAQAIADVLNPVVGEVLFEEHFNTSLNETIWNKVEGDGCNINLCNWGNQELQTYSANNLTIENVPFEPATRALAIEARRQVSGAYQFTSGKIDSKDKMQVKYGLIEVRMSTPAVGTGLWPAAWMLGTSPASWPAKGEIDIMEMGHMAQARADAGFPGADINSYVGANAIFYASAACVPENPTCAAMTAWQTDNAYVAHTPLVNRFVIYRLYWTDSQMRFTIVDNGVETDLYNAPIPITEEATEFQAPFYLLFNLAVGGTFTDARNPGQVTAPFPGKMYIDYVRISKLNGLGEVKIGNPYVPETGTFGVFTDNTPTTNKLVPGANADIWIWNTTSVTAGTLPAYEGSNVIAWKYTAPQWFGGGIASRQINDMSNFVNGNLKFRIKIPANVGFKIGVRDNYTNENWVNFPAGQTTYGLVRNGEWAQATIPVSVVRGNLIALQAMTTLFSIASLDPLPTSNFEMAIDDIVWECGTSAACQATITSSSRSSVSSSRASSSIVHLPSSSSVSSSRSSVSSSVSSVSSSRSSISSSRSSVSSSVSSSVRSSSSSVAAAVVTLYNDINYGGWSARFAVGTYSYSAFIATGAVNDQVTSVRVPAGYKVVLYEHGDFTGTTVTLTADTPSLLPFNFNDKTSAVVVSLNTTASSSSARTSSSVASSRVSSSRASSVSSSSVGAGACAGVAQYVDRNTYATGAVVQNNNNKYTCTVGGWCTIGGPYAPGVGWAWTNAWTLSGSCQ